MRLTICALRRDLREKRRKTSARSVCVLFTTPSTAIARSPHQRHDDDYLSTCATCGYTMAHFARFNLIRAFRVAICARNYARRRRRCDAMAGRGSRLLRRVCRQSPPSNNALLKYISNDAISINRRDATERTQRVYLL